MNATMTYSTAAFDPRDQLRNTATRDSDTAARRRVRARRTGLLASIRLFFRALLEASVETPYGLPVPMGARLYL